MSGDPKDTQLSKKERRIQEYMEVGYVTLPADMRVVLKFDTSEKPDDYRVFATLSEPCVTLPKIIIYSKCAQRIFKLYGFELTSQELIELESESLGKDSDLERKNEIKRELIQDFLKKNVLVDVEIFDQEIVNIKIYPYEEGRFTI